MRGTPERPRCGRSSPRRGWQPREWRSEGGIPAYFSLLTCYFSLEHPSKSEGNPGLVGPLRHAQAEGGCPQESQRDSRSAPDLHVVRREPKLGLLEHPSRIHEAHQHDAHDVGKGLQILADFKVAEENALSRESP